MRKKITLLTAVTAGALLLAGCSGTAAKPSEVANGELTKITVGVMPVVDVAAVYLGVEKGFFEEEGLELKLEPAQGGAAITPAVVSGDYEFGIMSVTSVLLGAEKGVPIQAVTASHYSTGEVPDTSAVVVPADSDIQTAADLEGKTVALNTLSGIGDTTVQHVVDEAGADGTKVKFTEMGFPDMPAAIAAKQVDAAWIYEPHLTRALNDGARVVSWNLKETDPDLMISVYSTSKAYAAEHPEIVEAFTTAMNRSIEYAAENPDEVRATVGTYMDLDPELLASMTMPRYKAEMNVESTQLIADLLLGMGVLKEPLDASKLLP